METILNSNMHYGTEINDDDDGDMTVLSAVSTEA